MVEEILKHIEGPAWMLVLVIYLPKIVEAIQGLEMPLDRLNSTIMRAEMKLDEIESRMANVEINVKYQEKLYNDLSRSNK